MPTEFVHVKELQKQSTLHEFNPNNEVVLIHCSIIFYNSDCPC